MIFLGWYGIGAATIVILLLVESYINSRSISIAFRELYEILISKTDILSVTILLLVALLGPLVSVGIAHFMVRAWYDSLPVDDNDKKDFPWTKD